MNAVVLDRLEKRFGDFVAVNGISLTVARGEIFGFLGPNGAGKSTTIRMLCGILPPSGGSGTVAGHDIRGEAEEIKKSIGYMSQKFSLYDDLTVDENLDFYGGIYGLDAKRLRARKEEVLDLARLRDQRERRTGVLPQGWKQRLSLGCAILHEPPIVFLDEPTSGVDPISRRDFWELIYRLADGGVTVFVTTHYMEEAEYCQRLALIYRGELVALGTSEELKAESMSGAVIEIVTDRAAEAMDVVGSVPGVRDVALFGRGLHATADDAEHAVRAIGEALRGFAVEKVAPVRASLEDVFVALIEREKRS